ncbi:MULTISPECIES: Fe-S cluster assembly protein NifU [unclassified Agarivorans]|uniref:Fe-S cluster assembly protein NifU n=1 Tax=unclassified Agarivorans TaxID=2636026 RepID=UPI0026E38E15|nr:MULTISPECIES: Fe-S cluster assembly protein NifU [unclassified Agarivorans]MDO6685961.1 Fe-S cluster assembly protein NifU [Agarivorans sp. 3_MG-2023]MDO6713901.1 Fe-S cluster assembly protein NifU [Agarivorans sp. 2_MG-2023]MDO6762233.1 Fe-S cluster assembly protein NifU [Agarivorans sp. 1_MG-2023]
MWNYSEKVKQHFFQPKNAKAVDHANAIGDVGSISCGDALRLSLKVNPDSDVIEDAGFQTFGCGSAIASSSALTEMIIGQTIDQAMRISNQDIVDFLDGLPPEKMHCSVMGMEALHAAVAQYRGEEIAEEHEEGELICKCFAIDDALIKRVVSQNKLETLDEVINYTKAGGACAACHEKIEWVLEECLGAPLADPIVTPASPSKANTIVGKIRLIEQALEQVRPQLQADGGDVQLSDVEDDMVFVSLTGACNGCGLSGATLAMIEQKISAVLGETITVYPTGAASLA